MNAPQEPANDITRALCHRRGFTVVSMLVAIILLAVGMTSLATANGSTIKMETLAQNRTNAIARSFMEEVRTRDPWTLVSETGVTLNADGQAAATGAYVRTMDVVVTRQNLLQISVSVAYPRGTQPVALTTSFFRGNALAVTP